jgi:hypothetical protein
MRILVGLLVVAAACSGPAAKKESPLVPEGSGGMPENCCCKSHPLTSEDGRPVYESTNRMECGSAKHGDCVDEVQCQKAPASETPVSDQPPPPPPG